MKLRDSPSLIRRLAAGAWHVPAGLAFVLRRPRLWPLAAAPAALTSALLVAGAVGGLLAVPWLDETLGGEAGRSRSLTSLVLALGLWAGAPLMGLLLGLALGLLLAAPVLDQLSVAVERLETGAPGAATQGLVWEVAESLKGALYFALRSPFILLVGLVPAVGPLLSAAWGAHALAFQLTDGPLARRRLDFMARRVWHRRHRAESLGFGLAGLLALLVPLANLLLAPALVVGATRLALELLSLERQPAPETEAAPPPQEAAPQ
ncbi:MAG: EI24 domain-containing protein [Vicinamibacteria bacterium]